MEIGWRRKHVVNPPPCVAKVSPVLNYGIVGGTWWYWMLQKVLVFVFLDSCSLNFDISWGNSFFSRFPPHFGFILSTQPAILVDRRCKPCQPTCRRCPPFACCVPIQPGTMHSHPFHQSLALDIGDGWMG